MKKRFIAILSTILCTMALAACAGASFTTWPGGGTAEFTDLNKTIDCLLELNFTNIVVDVELESGSVDIEIVDADVFPGDVEDYVEVDTIFTAEGLVDGDTVSCLDDDGDVVVRITGHGATGTITFSEG